MNVRLSLWGLFLSLILCVGAIGGDWAFGSTEPILRPAAQSSEAPVLNSPVLEIPISRVSESYISPLFGTSRAGESDGEEMLGSDCLIGDGSPGTYALSRSGVQPSSVDVYLNGILLDRSEYLVLGQQGLLVLLRPAPVGAEIRVNYAYSQSGASSNALELTTGEMSLLPLSPHFKMGLVYAEGKAHQNLPRVRGLLADYDGGFLLSTGYFFSTPNTSDKNSYFRQRLAVLAAQRSEATNLTQLSPSPTPTDEVIPLMFKFQNGILDFQSRYWKVDPSFALPEEADAAQTKNQIISALKAVGAPADDWNSVRGLEHLDRSFKLNLPAQWRFSTNYSQHQNHLADHSEFGLVKTSKREELAFGEDNSNLRLNLVKILNRSSWENNSQPTTTAVEKQLALSHNLGGSALIGLSRVSNTTINEGTGQHSKIDTTTYNWNNIKIFGAPALKGSVVITEPSGEESPLNKQIILESQTPLLKLWSALKVNAKYEETQTEGQGSSSTLTLTAPTFNITPKVKIDSINFVRSVDSQDAVTEQLTAPWSVEIIPGFSVNGQFQSKEADGQGYWFNKNFNLTQKLSDSTNLTTAFTREENNGQKVKGIRQFILDGATLSDKLTFKGTYEEVRDPENGVSPVLDVEGKLSPMGDVSFGGRYIQRDQPDNERLVTKEIHLQLPLGQLKLQGDYVMNPPQDGNRDEIASLTTTKRWSLSGPVGDRLTVSGIYDEVRDADNSIRSVFETKGELSLLENLSVAGRYIQRDQPDNSRLVTKEIHVKAPLFGGFKLQGDYAMNPIKDDNRDEIASRTITEKWVVSGPVSKKLNLSLSHNIASNLEDNTRADTTDVSLRGDIGPDESLSLAFRLVKNYGEETYSHHQGFLANYHKNVDENHYLRLSLTDEPDELSFFGEKTSRDTSRDDTRLMLEYATTF